MSAAAGGRRVVLGTAGHLDHGKSTLVQALTGEDPDRLAEEKRRGSCRTAARSAWWTCRATSASCAR